MVSLPPINVDGLSSQAFSNQDPSKLSLSNTSFCMNCIEELPFTLQVHTTNPKILQHYKERHAQLRIIERLFLKESTNNNQLTFDTTMISTSNSCSKESLFKKFFSEFGFPPISQSKLEVQRKDFEWKQLHQEFRKKQTKCKIIHFSSQVMKKHRPRTIIRQLPALETSKPLMKSTRIFEDKYLCKPTLIAEPESIIFRNFKVGQTLMRKVKVTNISNTNCNFRLRPGRSGSQFKVEGKHMSTLAAGMSVQLTVAFQCHSLGDDQEGLVITVQKGPDLVISVQAKNPSPYLIETNNSTCNVECVSPSLIECGSNFVGDEYESVINLKNIGSSGRFCFLSEKNWHDLDFVIDSSNSLTTGPFVIKPMYFSLYTGQSIEVSIWFRPPFSGLHTAQLFLLCDNTSVKRVDITGDGLLFSTSWITLHDISRKCGMLKTFDVNIQDDANADYFVDFGTMLSWHQNMFCFLLIHTGSVNMSYHWEMKEAAIPGLTLLPPGALRTIPDSGRLHASTFETVCLLCDTRAVQPGQYRILLALVVDDLPKKCIPLDENLTVLNSNIDDELFSIEVMTFEVWLKCVQPNIVLVPYIIDFFNTPLICGSPTEKRLIKVINESPGILKLTWIPDKESPQVRLNIEPTQIQVGEFLSAECTLTVEALQEGTFSDTFWCISDIGDVRVELKIEGHCCKGQSLITTDFVDFGLVMQKSHHEAELFAKCSSTADKLHWTINELNFSGTSDDGQLEETVNSGVLSANEGQFCDNSREVFVNYQLNTEEDTMWCSVLDWSGQHVAVIADIQCADVRLSIYTITADSWHVGIQQRVTLVVTNHTHLSIALVWGDQVRGHEDAVVDVKPRFAVLQPAQQLFTEIFITLFTLGPLENFYIPCFVQGQPQPLLLKVEGVVEGLKVRVEWDSQGHSCSVVWPPVVRESVKHSVSVDSLICLCPPNSEESGNSSCEVLSIHEHNNNIVERLNSDGGTAISQVTSIPYLNWPLVGGRNIREPMSEEMERHFKSLFTLEEFKDLSDVEETFNYPVEQDTLCFHDVLPREPVTQVVYIRNDSMISSTFEAFIVNNFERPQQSRVLDRVVTNLNDRHFNQDEWCRRASQDRGLTVFVQPARGELPPQDYVCLYITVYALSWGCYRDGLVIQLRDLDDLCVRLSVRVNQHPVTAPHLLRFGALYFRSPEQTCQLKVNNSSTVPVYICWELFHPSSDGDPFTLILFDGSPFELHLAPFYGSSMSPHFQVLEKYTFIKPRSSTFINVRFIPASAHISISRGIMFETLKAVLVGHVYLTDEARYITNTESCIRSDGIKLKPLTVDLEAYVEIPTLSLLNVFNYQLTFKCRSYDVMSSVNKVWSEEKVIMVQNQCYTELRARVSTVGYFYISRIKYPCPQERSNNTDNEICLQPGETCELTLVCEVSEKTLLECFEEEPTMPETILDPGVVKFGSIHFEQDDLKQEVKLELWLYQAVLHCTVPYLNFGLVFIEDTKVLIATLTAPIGKELFEIAIKDGRDDVFSLSVERGTLEPKVKLLVQISFSPQACVTYRDVLVIRTCLDNIYFEIPLLGVGTFNYKPHMN